MPSHVLVIGETQSGKTHWANQLHRTFPGLSVFFNTNHVSYVWGTQISSLANLQIAVKQGARKFNWIPPHDKAQAQAQLMQLWHYLFSKGREGVPWCQIVLDEAQRFEGTDSTEGPPEDIARRALGKGIRLVLVTQYSVGLKPDTRTNCPTRIIFKPGIEGQRFLQTYGAYPAEAILAHTAKPRHWASYEPAQGWQYHPPL